MTAPPNGADAPDPHTGLAVPQEPFEGGAGQPGSATIDPASFRVGAEAMRAAAIAECDCVITDAFDTIADDKKLMGEDYDPNSYGAGSDNGEMRAARNLADRIRALPAAAPQGGG